VDADAFQKHPDVDPRQPVVVLRANVKDSISALWSLENSASSLTNWKHSNKRWQLEDVSFVVFIAPKGTLPEHLLQAMFAMFQYERFMKLKAAHPEAMLIPTLDIQVVWVSHMLRPSVYRDDCIKLFGTRVACDDIGRKKLTGIGRVIPHHPYRDEVHTKFAKVALKDTMALWKKTYGVPYCEDNTAMVWRNCAVSHVRFEVVVNCVQCYNWAAIQSTFHPDTAKEVRKWKNPFGFVVLSLVAIGPCVR
jgi:hypothetical protein